ncbi:MAG TPA: cupin domain-containing protein [Rhizobacter sp.]|nr:cupin domain-containing protein [Rhizobacter sp.]
MNRLLVTLLTALSVSVSVSVQAADPDPSVMIVKREADMVWVENPSVPGLKMAVLYGNPGAPGPYVIRVRFSPGTMSPPHFHPEERQIVVLKGTWWVGTGSKWDREATVPMPAGSFAVHHPGKIHYDGAKDEEVVVQISGVGPSGTKLVDESGQAK